MEYRFRLGLRVRSMLLCAGLMIAGSCAGAEEKQVYVHTSSLPAGVSLPEAETDYAYFEGERTKKDGDIFKAPSQEQRTFFCQTNTPDDKYWSTHVPYDHSRFAARGADKDLPWHGFVWSIENAGLTDGIYDAFARVMVSPSGSAELALKTAAGVPESGVTVAKANISWVNLGSVELADGASLHLSYRTKKSAVRLDTLLLVRVKPEEATVSQAAPDKTTAPITGIAESAATSAAEVSATASVTPTAKAPVIFARYDVTPPGWQKNKGIIFSTDSAILGYRSDNPEVIEKVSASVKTWYQDAAGWKEVGQARPGEWQIPLPEPGWYEVHVQAQMKNGDVLTREIAAVVLGEPIPEEWRMKSVFGLWNVHGDAALIKLAGARWNRRMTSFRDVTIAQVEEATLSGGNPTPNGKPVDRAYTNRDGLDYLGVFSFGMPLWSMQLPENYKKPGFGNPFYPAKDWRLVTDAVMTFAMTHSLPAVVEMYNEPLAHWKGTREELVAYAQAVRAGLKAADPRFKLAGPCLYSIRLGDLQGLARAGLFKHLDAISMHAYVDGTPPEGDFLTRIIELKKLLMQYDQSAKPVYLTEFGWTMADGTWQPAVDPRTRTRYVARSLALGWSQGIDAMVFFALQFNTRNAGEAGFSLVDQESRPRPGYAAFSAVSKWFAASLPLGYFRLTPDVHMVMGTREGKLQLALWSTGPERVVRLPFAVERAADLFGKMVAVDAGAVSCTEDPVYLEADAQAAGSVSILPELTTTASTALPDGFVWPLAEMNSEKTLAGLSAGMYTGFMRTAEAWSVQPVQIVSPLTIQRCELYWPLKKTEPSVLVTLHSNRADSEQTACVSLDQGRVTRLRIPANATRQVAFVLSGIQPAQKFSTTIGLAVESAAQNDEEKSDGIQYPFSGTVLSAAGDASQGQWSDFSEWGRFGEAGAVPDGVVDCQADLKLSYNENGIRVQVRVKDDEHAQEYAGVSPELIWSADSIQIAFDVDKDKPWQAGVLGSGLGGHRVFEYSVGGRDGVAQVFRHRSYSPTLTNNALSENAAATVTREGDVTTYDVFFPWSEFDVQTPLKAGGVIGFALAVNDIDPAREAKRHGLRLFSGIVQSKDAKEYGRVWLR